jgi:hypothetical protein
MRPWVQSLALRKKGKKVEMEVKERRKEGKKDGRQTRGTLAVKQIILDWRCGASNRAPVWQVGSPEFRLQSHKKNYMFKKLNAN